MATALWANWPLSLVYEKRATVQLIYKKAARRKNGVGGALYQENCTGRGVRDQHLPFLFLSSQHGWNLVMRCGLEAFRPQAAFALQGERLWDYSICGHVMTPEADRWFRRSGKMKISDRPLRCVNTPHGCWRRLPSYSSCRFHRLSEGVASQWTVGQIFQVYCPALQQQWGYSVNISINTIYSQMWHDTNLPHE